MPRNSSRQDAIIKRRENVARLRLRGLSQREICKALMELPEPIRNDKGEAFDVATINRDLKALEAEWRARAAEAIDQRKARQLAEIDEAKRKAWSAGDLQALARFIKLESDNFGTQAPSKVEVADLRDKADDELIREFQSIVDAARARAGAGDSSGTEAA
jgi:DNA-binding CsgD family transcriptional regulator